MDRNKEFEKGHLVRKMTSALEILSLRYSHPASRMEMREVRARDTDVGFVWRVM